MLTCSMLACLMVFIQDAHERADLHAQLRDDVEYPDMAWVHEPLRRPPVQIRGPYWSRGFALHRTKDQAVWLTPGAPAPALGHTFGAVVSVDF